jgi:hypothetical protein
MKGIMNIRELQEMYFGNVCVLKTVVYLSQYSDITIHFSFSLITIQFGCFTWYYIKTINFPVGLPESSFHKNYVQKEG